MNKRHNRASQIHRTDMTRADRVPIHLRAGMMALHCRVLISPTALPSPGWVRRPQFWQDRARRVKHQQTSLPGMLTRFEYAPLLPFVYRLKVQMLWIVWYTIRPVKGWANRTRAHCVSTFFPINLNSTYAVCPWLCYILPDGPLQGLAATTKLSKKAHTHHRTIPLCSQEGPTVQDPHYDVETKKEKVPSAYQAEVQLAL